MKIIKYYKKSVYGVPRCYAIDPEDKNIIRNITGLKTIETNFMNNITALSNGMIAFQEVVEPANLENNQ